MVNNTNTITGNKNLTSDFLQVLLKLEKKTMKDLSVAEVCEVISTNYNYYQCISVNNSNEVYNCYKLDGLEINKKDIVLVIYTNTDFRQNLERIKKGATKINTTTEEYHSKSYGIIIGKLIGGEK